MSKKLGNNTTRARAVIIHAGAFLVPLAGLALTWAVLGIHPFGEMSVLTMDLRSQYISFFSTLRNQLFLGGESWLYTFSKALGGDMAGLSAYYLLSPFNLLLLFFPTHALPSGVALITLLKVGCCGLTMSLLLNRGGPRFATLLFSIPYALMDFNNAFQQNIMWLDGVILLPLVVLGVEWLLENRPPWLYIITLFMAIVTNYYVGFMLCLFSLLYFLVSFFCFHDGDHRRSGLKSRAWWAPVGRYVTASLVGVGLSAVVLVPALASLQGGKGGQFLQGFLDPSHTTLPDVVSRYLPGTVNVQMLFMGYPQVYCGVLALVCTILYFVNKAVTRRDKIGAGILVGVLLLSFCVGPMDRIWQGFNKPVGFLHRYSFIFSFVLLFVGWAGFSRLRRGGAAKYLPWVVAGVAAAVVLSLREGQTYITTGKLLLGLGLLLAVALLLWLYANKKMKYALLLLVGVMLADMGANLLMAIRRIDYYPYAGFEGHVQQVEPLVEGIKVSDDSFYRMEYLYRFSENDAMLFGTRGLTHYSSADKLEVREFLEAMGLSQYTNSVKYAGGSTVAVDSLLSVKYLIGAGPLGKDYAVVDQQNGLTVWQNPLALPVGVMAGEGVTGLLEASDNLFEVHNAMWRAILPEEKRPLYRLFEEQSAPVVENLNRREVDGEILYESTGVEGDAYLEYELVAESDDALYLLMTCDSYRGGGANVYVNGEQWADGYLTGDNHGIFALGRYAEGEKVTVRLVPKTHEFFVKDTWFATEDVALLEAMTGELKTAGFSPRQFTGAMMVGTVHNPQGLPVLLLSIPYDAGWQVTVDGKKVVAQRAFGALTAVPVPAGSHELTLHYMPAGLVIGALTSAVALGGLLLWIILSQRKKALKKG